MRKGWLRNNLCENLPFAPPGVGQEWYLGGPGLERVWNGTEWVWNETAHSSTALPPRSTSLSKLVVWSENSAASNSLTASWLAAAKRISTIATVGSNYK